MNDIERIRKKVYGDNKSSRFNWLYRLMIVFMVSISIFLGALIVTQTPFSDVKMMVYSYVEDLELNDLLLFENWFSGSSIAVNGSFAYELVRPNYYKNNSNIVYAIDDGVVVYVTSYDGYYQVIVNHDNGVLCTYSDVLDVMVKVDDRILKDSILGTYQDAVYMDFMYENVDISYEEALLQD